MGADKIIGASVGDIAKIDNIAIGDIASIMGETVSSFANTYSMNFDGVDDKMLFDEVSLGTDYTLSAWAKRDSTANMFLFGNEAAYGYGAYFNGVANLYFKEAPVQLITFNNAAIQTALARTDWVNWVFVKDNGAGTVSVYVDGVLAETYTGAKTGMSTMTSIGGSGLASGTQYIWNGNIDEVAIFNTSSVNLADLSSSGAPADLTSVSGLTHWWRMGENGTWDGSNWTLIDQGSGGTDATSSNMVEADREEETP